MSELTGIICQPVTPARWADFERLCGPRGACAGCWRTLANPIIRRLTG